jgi:hypothetical protein
MRIPGMVKEVHVMMTLVILICSRSLKHMIKDRAGQLGFSAAEYLKYIAVKDYEESEIKK